MPVSSMLCVKLNPYSNIRSPSDLTACNRSTTGVCGICGDGLRRGDLELRLIDDDE